MLISKQLTLSSKLIKCKNPLQCYLPKEEPTSSSAVGTQISLSGNEQGEPKERELQDLNEKKKRILPQDSNLKDSQ